VRVQIICKHTTAEQISEQLMVKFGSIERFEIVPRRGHVLVELHQDSYQRAVLECCRQNKYAYLRLVEWEQGGHQGYQGRSVCVAGLECEPLKPVTIGTRENSLHGLFCNRDGLLVAMGGTTTCGSLLRVTRVSFQHQKLSRRIVADLQWEGPFEDALAKCPHWYDQWSPLMRAAVRKMNCLHCTHIHYQAIEDSEGTNDSEKSNTCSRC